MKSVRMKIRINIHFDIGRLVSNAYSTNGVRRVSDKVRRIKFRPLGVVIDCVIDELDSR